MKDEDFRNNLIRKVNRITNNINAPNLSNYIDKTKFEVNGNLLITQIWCKGNIDHKISKIIGEDKAEDEADNSWQDAVIELDIIKTISYGYHGFSDGMTVIYNQNCTDFTINVPYEEFKPFWIDWQLKHDKA